MLAGKFGKVFNTAAKTYKGYSLAGGDPEGEMLARMQLVKSKFKMPDSEFRSELQMVGYSPDDLIMADNKYVMSALIEGDDTDSDIRSMQTYVGKPRGFLGTDYATYRGIQEIAKNPLSGKLRI